MDAHKIKHDLFIAEWSKQIRDQQESGMNIKEWCQANGIPVSTFNFRQRKVREAVLGVNKDLAESNAAINLAQVHLHPEAQAYNINFGKDICISGCGVDIRLNSSVEARIVHSIIEVMLNAQ